MKFLTILYLFLFFFLGVKGKPVAKGTNEKGVVFELFLNGVINPLRAEYIEDSIDDINLRGITNGLILINIDTPGGHDTSMRKIIQKILASKLPVAVFVNPSGARAASAGFYILLSADIPAMAPGTNTGAAHPVFALGGLFPIKKEDIDETLLEKATNDAIAFLKSFTTKRGRNVEEAVKAVTENKSFTAEEAKKANLISFIAKDKSELLKMIDGKKIKRIHGDEVTLSLKNYELVEIKPDFRTRFLLFIANPILALLLALTGIFLIYFEIKNPGMIAPGVIGALCLVISLMGFSLLPINFIGVILIIGGIGLLIAEALMPGFGVLGISGLIGLFIGSVVLIKSPLPEMRISYSDALFLTIPFAILIIIIGRLAIKAHKNRVETGSEGMIGMKGVVVSDLKPAGKVLIRGEYWNAESLSGEEIKKDSRVVVKKVEDLTLFVEPVSKQTKN